MLSQHGLYTYGIVGKSQKLRAILGIDKKNEIYPIGKGDISAVVSKIDTDKFQGEVKKLLSELAKADGSNLSKTDGILRAHEKVVDAIAKLTAIVPFKFGTILKDEKAASKMLKNYEEKFKVLLAKFTGKEEWGLKVFCNLKKIQSNLSESQSARKIQLEKQQSKGITYLLGKKMEEKLKDKVNRQLTKIANTIFESLGKYAFETQLNKTLPKKLTGKEEEMILNSAYLIEKEKISDFHKQIAKLRVKYQPLGFVFEISGPWPAYNFT